MSVPLPLAGLPDQLPLLVRKRGALQVALHVVQEGLAVLGLLLPQLAGGRVQLLLGSLNGIRESGGAALHRKLRTERAHSPPPASR